MRMYFGNEEDWATLPTERTAALAKQNGLDVEAVEVPGDHFSSVPEAIRSSIEFFKRFQGLEAPAFDRGPGRGRGLRILSSGDISFLRGCKPLAIGRDPGRGHGKSDSQMSPGHVDREASNESSIRIVMRAEWSRKVRIGSTCSLRDGIEHLVEKT